MGSVRQLVDPSQAVRMTQTFDPFGQVLEQAGSTQSSFGYTGEQTDPTDLVFLRARYYDPALGRFLTADSIIPDPLSSQGWNRYGYVSNNPIRYTDPSGHCIVQWSGEVRPNQYPYGTSGVCPHSESHLTEAPHEVTAVAESPGFGDDPTRVPAMVGTTILLGGPSLITIIPRLISMCSAACADGDCTNELGAAYNVGNRTIEATTGLGKIASQLQTKSNLLNIQVSGNMQSLNNPQVQKGLSTLNNISTNPDRVVKTYWKHKPVYEYIKNGIGVVRDRVTGELITVLDRTGTNLDKLQKMVENGTAQWLK